MAYGSGDQAVNGHTFLWMNLRRASSRPESGNQLDSMVVLTIDIQTLPNRPIDRAGGRQTSVPPSKARIYNARSLEFLVHQSAGLRTVWAIVDRTCNFREFPGERARIDLRQKPPLRPVKSRRQYSWNGTTFLRGAGEQPCVARLRCPHSQF